jgi:RNA polymerase sigma-70 factor, ECF subfamily
VKPDRAPRAGPDITDGDLVRLAQAGDEVAFRLLVERHQPMARARARSLAHNLSDVDDIVQESFLRAFTALDRLRDPDRFAGWLAGIVLNVCRGLQRRAPLTLLPDWPERLHPASAGGLPSADDLDRAEALRAALAGLPAGQQRAVALYYYADLPAGQITEPAGAARASLHKGRQRLRAYITEHRPDLIPAVSRRTPMTTVRITCAEHRAHPGRRPLGRRPTHLVVLADEAGGRELPVWLLPFDGVRLMKLLPQGESHQPRATPPEPGTAEASTADELTGQMLHAVGARVAGVDISELGPELTAARIKLAGPAGTRQVTARLAEGLAIAITTGAPVRVADSLMDRLAVPAGQAGPPGPGRDEPRRPDEGERGPGPAPARRRRPRYEPRNLAFASGLDGWAFGGSFTENGAQSHWHDYSATAQDAVAMIRSTVPQPEGFAILGQEIFAEDYRGATVTFRGEFRTSGGPGRAGLALRVNEGRPIRGPLTEEAVFADPDNNIAMFSGATDWTPHAVTARVPDDSDAFVFGIFLAGPGQVELRNVELVRG